VPSKSVAAFQITVMKISQSADFFSNNISGSVDRHSRIAIMNAVDHQKVDEFIPAICFFIISYPVWKKIKIVD
jgi:hypothetical protein